MKLNPEDISTALKDFGEVVNESNEPIALDLETTGLTPFVAEPTWLSWACGNRVGAIPILHRNPWQTTSTDPIKSLLKTLHQRTDSSVIWHNGAFDLSVLIAKNWLELVDINPDALFDTMLASYVLNPVKNNEGGKHSLKFLYREIRNQGDPDQPTFEAITKGVDFSDIPIAEAKWYSAFDAWATLKVFKKLSADLNNRGSENLLAYFKKIEMPHLLTTVEIITTGMRIRSQNNLPEDLWPIKDLYREYDETLKRIYELAGQTFNFTSPRSLRFALFNRAGIDPLGRGKKSKKHAIDKWTLAEIFSSIEKAYGRISNRKDENKRLIAWTLYAKLLLENIKKHEEFYGGKNPVTGKIHPMLRQTTTSGRYSCRSPNTLSMSTTSGIKSHLIPRDNCAFIIADFSQIDLRVIANETAVVAAEQGKESKMAVAVNNGVDLHINTLAIVDMTTKQAQIKKIHYENDKPDYYEKLDGKRIQVAGNDDLTATILDIKKKRSSIAKPLNFGISYGLGPKGLLSNLNNTEKFQDLIFKKLKDEFKENDWLKILSEQALKGNGNFTAGNASDFLSQFHSEYPEIPKFQEKIETDDLQKSGATENIFGRKCRAEGIQHLLSDTAVVDVDLGFGDWFRVHCRGISYEKKVFRCLITKVFTLEIGEDQAERRLRSETPIFELDLDHFDSATTQLQLGKTSEDEWRTAIYNSVENGTWGAEDFFDRIHSDFPSLKSSALKLWPEPLAPYAQLTHMQIKFIQSGPLSTFMRYPGYDALRRKLISYRVSSSSMDICKIAMIEFRKAVRQWFKQGKLKSLPRIINCIHDEIAVECHVEDTESVKSILKECMSFKSFDIKRYLANGRELLVAIEADIGSSNESYAKAKPA